MSTSVTDAVSRPVRRVRVFVVDGNEVVRRGLRDLLEYEGCEVVGGSGSAAEAIRDIAHLRPDVVLLDGLLSDGTELEVCRAVRATDPGIQCLLLTSLGDENALRRAVLAGASGYLLREAGNDRLVSNVRRAAAGETLLAPSRIERVSAQLAQALSHQRLALFTRREKRVASLMVEGLSNREIGADLALPDAVVTGLVSSVLTTLDTRPNISASLGPSCGGSTTEECFPAGGSRCGLGGGPINGRCRPADAGAVPGRTVDGAGSAYGRGSMVQITQPADAFGMGESASVVDDQDLDGSIQGADADAQSVSA